ncbi:MAG: hypothetical protein KGD64_04030 [Candidatus Heimdallarchaeota archaeon]|nr:hypothetical protein [Candidatus Heimdallarchaeota archaeon]
MFSSFALQIILGMFFLTILLFILIVVFILKKQKIDKNQDMIKNFDTYMAVLQYHMERAFEIVHKDQILIYSLEATGVPDDKFSEASSSFGNLVIKMMGPMLYDEFRYLYGGDDALLFNVIEYFNTKYETDEIRAAALDNLTTDEEEEK